MVVCLLIASVTESQTWFSSLKNLRLVKSFHCTIQPAVHPYLMDTLHTSDIGKTIKQDSHLIS